MSSTTDLFQPVPYELWSTDPQSFADQLGASFRETGFAVVSGHPLDEAILNTGLEAAKSFFALPAEKKRQYFIAGGGGQRGYTPFGTEIAKDAKARDLKEFWHVGRELPADHPYAQFMDRNLYVAEIANWRDRTEAMFNALDTFGGDLLAAIALHLGLEERFFDDPVRDGNSILRMLHYPAQEEPPAPGSVRAGAHEDINVITLLLGAEEAGLEVLHRNGDWLSVNPPPGSLVVNIGDMLQRLTNHVLPSTTHRVVNPSRERARFSRYSTPFFLHFRPDYEIRTLPSCVTAENADRYPAPITAQAYLLERLKQIGLMS